MDRPNVVLIFTDQWRGDFLGSLHDKVKTPFLDQLAGEGIMYTSAYCATPSCIPARASLLTGMSGSSCNRIGYMDGVPWRYPVTMQGVFRDAGYQTINVGKTHYYPRREGQGFEINRLYDPQNWLDGEKSDYHKWLNEETGGKVIDPADAVDNNGFCYIPWTYDNYLHPTEWTADTAMEEIKNRDKERPFFMQIGFHRPHPPLDPPEAYFNMYRDTDFGEAPIGDWEPEEWRRETTSNAPLFGVKSEEDRQVAIRAYCAQLTHIDHQIGKIIYYIRRYDHTKNTIIMFTSDHGDLLGDHCTWRKIFPYEGSSKIPMILNTPDKVTQTVNTTLGYRKDSTPVTHMDIMPTLLSLANIDVPGNVEGIDFSGPLYGRKIEGREFIHGEHTAGETMGVQFVTDGKIKYCYDTLSGREELFDLVDDPGELRNLAGVDDYSNLKERWKKRLVEILEKRPDDGFVKNGELQTGIVPPPIRKELIKGLKSEEVHPNARKSIENIWGRDIWKNNI
jgi:arylsulfatase A-like enzyme